MQYRVSVEGLLLTYIAQLEDRVSSLAGSVGGARAALEEFGTALRIILDDETVCPPEVAARICRAVATLPPLEGECRRLLLERCTPKVPASNLNTLAAVCTPVEV